MITSIWRSHSMALRVIHCGPQNDIDALKSCKQELEIQTKLLLTNHPDLVSTSFNLGRINSKLTYQYNALEYIQASVPIMSLKDTTGDYHFLELLYFKMGTSYDIFENHQAMTDNYEKVLQIQLKATENRIATARKYMELALDKLSNYIQSTKKN